MSASNDPGAQSNPEQEQGLPLSMQLDPAHADHVALDGGRNGINGAHHDHPHEGAPESVPGSVQESVQAGDTPDEGVPDAALPDAALPDVELPDVELPDAVLPVDGDQPVTPEAGKDAGPEVTPALITEEGDASDAPDASAELKTPRSAVKIKGRPGGVSLELGDGEWDELMLLLTERLTAAEGFFRGGRVLLEVGARPLVEDHLRQVRTLLEQHEMQLAVVRSTAERTLQAAADVGLATTSEEPAESLHVPEPPLIVPDGPPNAYTPSPYASPPDNTGARPNHFVHRGSLRSGQVLRKTESIVVIGDVNPGAQVVSGGDVMVWGRLRGIAHAGAEGNRRSVVAAIDFEPTQLRIANLTAIAPERKKPRSTGFLFWKKEPERGPEMARVVDGHIVVEPWDEGKPNGLGVWRK